jgi:protein-S-isoprenylcysteine O-methyltransferase Ste14
VAEAALVSGARRIFLLAIVVVLLYLIVAPLEERKLQKQYGDQGEAYMQEVPRFGPR